MKPDPAMKGLRHILVLAFLSFATSVGADAPSHQGSLYSCEGLPIPGVQHVDVAMPTAGRDYAWPANSASIHKWGSEILVAFRNYSYRWKGYWQHTIFSDAVDTNDCRNTLARSWDNGLTWSLEDPAGYSDFDRANPDIRDCAMLPGNGVPFDEPNLVFETVWLEHTGNESRHFFHWSTDRGKTWSPRYRLPMLNDYGHLEPRTDYLVENATTAIVFVSGDNMTAMADQKWTGAWISAYRTTDGGRTWTASQIGEKEAGVWKGMTSSVRVGPTEILTAVRNHRIVNKPHPGRIQSLADVYASTNNGATWQFRSTPWMLEENVFGNPASLVRLPSGKIVTLMANRRSSAQSHGNHLVSKIQCRVSGDQGRTWGPIYTIRDNAGTWDMGYQRATVREDGTVLLVYYYADRIKTTGPFHGEEENHRTHRRIAASIFDAESLSVTPEPIDPYRKLEATAADFGTVRWSEKFYVTDFDAGKHLVFKNLLFSHGLSQVRLGAASAKGGGRVEIRDGAINGPILGEFTCVATGGDLSFLEQAVPVRNLSGRHDIYFVSRDAAAANVDYVSFVAAPAENAPQSGVDGDRESKANAEPGGPQQPVVYEGPQLVDPRAPDGRLRLSPGVQNIQIARANRKSSPFFDGRPGYTYQHHIDLACWKGRLYAVWDMSPVDEDTSPCRLVYSTSSDGFNWSSPADLYPPDMGWNLRFYFYHASNGRMLVFAATPYPTKQMQEKEKTSVLVREITADHRLSDIWTLIKPTAGAPRPFEECGDPGFAAACREACGNQPLLEQQDYGVLLDDRRMKWHDGRNWPNGKVGGLDDFWTFGKALCFYHRKDGALVGLSKLGFATVSTDGGKTWSQPVVPRGIVASSGKIWGQATPDGRFAMVYPPQNPGPRYPMVVTTSDDGITFRDMRTIHGEVPPQRYAGKYKGCGPQYLRGVAEWAGDAQTIDKSAIWVIYSMNKEDIWVSRIPVPIVPEVTGPVHDTFEDVPPGPRVPGWNTYAPAWARVHIARDKVGANQFLELEDREPVDYARAVRQFPPSPAVDVSFRLAAGQTDRGHLEIELLGDGGTRPVRIVFDDKARVLAVNGNRLVALANYKSSLWSTFTIRAANGRYTLIRNGEPLLKDAEFSERSPSIYALSLRSGEFRGTVPPDPTVDLPGTEEPHPAVVYRVDDVTAVTSSQDHP